MCAYQCDRREGETDRDRESQASEQVTQVTVCLGCGHTSSTVVPVPSGFLFEFC